MMADDVAKNFIIQFHNLPGETVKDKHQNLFKLLQQHRSLKNDSKELASITANLKTTNHLEKILRTDFLIFFRLFDSLYDGYIKGDEITVKKLSKQEWFFQQAFKDVTCEDFTNKILPTISYSMKLRLLKKLSVAENEADQFFDAVHKRYGIFLATVLLPKCSSTKISHTLKHYPIKLTIAQLKCIFNKDTSLIFVYMEERIKIEGTSTFKSHNQIFKYIAQKNPEVFTILFDKYDFDTKLGHRTTKGLIKSQKNTVVSNTEKYLKILNKSAMVRKVGSEIKEEFFKKSPSRNGIYWKCLINYYPKSKQFDIFKSTYNCVYHKKFGEDVSAVSEDMLKIMPNSEERQNIALKKMEQEGTDKYLKYVTPAYCLKELMDKINHLTASERSKYVELATECCCLNDDLSSLLKLSELLCTRLKNDDESIKRSFLDKLKSHTNVLDNLDEKYWKNIIEIIITTKAKNGWVYGEDTFISKYVSYATKNNKSLKEIVKKSWSWDSIILYSTIKTNPTALKKLLGELIDVGLVKPNSDDALAAALFDCELAYYCKIYNDRNPNDVIPIFNNGRIIKSVKQVLEDQNNRYIGSSACDGIQYIVCQPSSCEEVQQLKKLYFESLKSVGRIGGLMWFLKREPKTLQDCFDQFLNNFVEGRGLNPPRLWKLVKKYSHLNLDKKTIEFCKQKLDEEFAQKESLVRSLTILSSPASHLEFIKRYVPTSEKVDLTDDDVKDFYKLQGKIVKLLHYLNSPSEVLNATLDFCKGDYLQFAQCPLYSCICRLPESDTKQFINKLEKVKALSVRKHAMHLSCVIYSTDDAYNCLKNATVPSLIPTIKYFSKNPSEALWKLLETRLCALEKNELQILKLALTKINIPVQYESKYVETVWNICDKHENKELKKLVLPKINKTCIENLNSEFAFKIMRSSIFDMDETSDVVSNILIYLKDDGKFTVLTDILSTFKKNCWNHSEMRKPSRRKLNSFVLNLFGKYMSNDVVCDMKFVTELEKIFSSIFTLSESFEESVAIKCMTFKGKNLEHQCNVLIHLNNTYAEKYEMFAVNSFADALSKYIFKHVFTKDSEKFELCHMLLHLKKSDADYLLIIKLLPNEEPQDKKHFELYNSIMTELKRVDNNVVQLQLNFYLKSGPYNKSTKLVWSLPRLCSNVV